MLFGIGRERMKLFRRVGNFFQKVYRKTVSAVDRYDDTHNFTCDFCGGEVFEGERVCKACFKTLPWNNKNICPFCGRRVGEAGACLDCKEKPLAVDRARSVFVHEGEARHMINRYKRGARYFCRTAAELALPIFRREFAEVDFLTYVPMTKKAEKKRGYNQSKLFAEKLSALCGKEVRTVAEKRRETKSQKTLGRREREENLLDCFFITDRKAVKGKSILILDDTLTTGSTVSELASRLKRAGATCVYALTISSVPKKDPFGLPPERARKRGRKKI